MGHFPAVCRGKLKFIRKLFQMQVICIGFLAIIIGHIFVNCYFTCKSSLKSSIALAAKRKDEIFFCDQCGVEHIKWVGRCSSCLTWNSVKPFRQPKALANAKSDFAATKTLSSWIPNTNKGLIPMDTMIVNGSPPRLQLFSGELGRVLGGGIVRGSVVLLAGEPGIGKSTLLMQIATSFGENENPDLKVSQKVVYMSGEENAEQITARARRLGVGVHDVLLLCDTDVDAAGVTLSSHDLAEIGTPFHTKNDILTHFLNHLSSLSSLSSNIRSVLGVEHGCTSCAAHCGLHSNHARSGMRQRYRLNHSNQRGNGAIHRIGEDFRCVKPLQRYRNVGCNIRHKEQ